MAIAESYFYYSLNSELFSNLFSGNYKDFFAFRLTQHVNMGIDANLNKELFILLNGARVLSLVCYGNGLMVTAGSEASAP